MCEIDWSALGQWAGVFITGYFSYLIWKIEKFRVDDEAKSKVYDLAFRKFRASNGLGNNDVLVAVQLAKRHKKQTKQILSAYRDFQESAPSRMHIGMLLIALAAQDPRGKWPSPEHWNREHEE